MSYPQTTCRQTAFTGKSLLSTRRTTISRTTVHAQLDQLRQTGRYDCFKLHWHPVYDDKSNWPVPPHLFWDSDIGKWIEGACYLLADDYDDKVDNAIQELVEMIRGAQQPDGYLNLHYTVVEPGKRWSNLRDMHELYNAGHLIEAAIAHREYYHNDLLVEPMQKYISLIRKVFGPDEGQLKGYPGHPEIELALLRFHSVVGSTDAYELARFFLNERGNPKGQDGKHYYDVEMEKRGETLWTRPDPFPVHRAYWYCQAHLPISEQPTVEGHSVRAMYLLTAVADLVLLSNEGTQSLSKSEAAQWTQALERLWNNMVDQKMYLTGGIGAMKQWEGFGINYFLPQGTDDGGCYSETCASIGVMMLGDRLLRGDLDGKYADIIELCLYNNVMTAMSLDGKAFTYVNQLASSDADKSAREEWFTCACCPPNLMRLFGSIGGYLWHYGSQDGEAFINVHLYTKAEVTFNVGEASIKLRQTSNWPWEGNIMFQLSGAASVKTTIRLRLPAWSKGKYVLTPTPEEGKAKIEKGYLYLDPTYVAENPSFSLQILGFEPRYLSPHPYTNQKTLTLARGPIVYCVEDTDNTWEKNHFKDIMIKTDSPVSEEKRIDKKTNEEYVALSTTSWERSLTNRTSVYKESVSSPRDLVFVPYYFRANRGGNGHMRVGLLSGDGGSGIIFPEKWDS